MPWLGWFDIINQSDIVIILDDVAFSKQSWQQRNRIRAPGGLQYLTLPVKTSGLIGQLISEVEISKTQNLIKILKTIRQNYIKSTFFDQYYESFFERFVANSKSGKLIDINMGLIHWFLHHLGIDKNILLASELNVGGRKSEHVINLCQEVGASHYLSPASAFEYIHKDKHLFEKSGLEVEFHNYQHPIYKQYFSPFLPYASTLDLLMNEGVDSMSIIDSGQLESRLLFSKG